MGTFWVQQISNELNLIKTHQMIRNKRTKRIRKNGLIEKNKRVRIGEKRLKCPKTLSFWEAWLQIGCKNALSICYQNDLNMFVLSAVEKSAAFFV